MNWTATTNDHITSVGRVPKLLKKTYKLSIKDYVTDRQATHRGHGLVNRTSENPFDIGTHVKRDGEVYAWKAVGYGTDRARLVAHRIPV